MRFIKAILILLFVAALHVGWLPRLQAADASTGAAAGAEEEHGVPQKATEIWKPLGFPITNSMAVSWIVAVGLIVFARRAMRP